MRAMVTDYPSIYRKAYPSKSEARALKERLMKLLINIHPTAIIDGYEACIEQNNYMPTVPDLCRSITTEHKKQQRGIREKEDVEQIALNPPKKTTYRGDPIKMLRDALNARQDIPKNEPEAAKAERLARKANALQSHDELIARHKKEGKIRKVKEDVEAQLSHRCGKGGCFNVGVFTQSTLGSDTWFCSDHADRRV